jgi:hypothetical protein
MKLVMKALMYYFVIAHVESPAGFLFDEKLVAGHILIPP